MQPIIENSYLVEVNLGTLAAGKIINFQYYPELDGAIVYGVQAYSQSDLNTSPQNKTVVANAGLASIGLTLVVGDKERVTLQSCYDLRSANVAGFVRMYNNLKVNFVKSFIQLFSVTSLNANESVLFNFIYRKP